MARHRTLPHVNLIVGTCIDCELIKYFPASLLVCLFSQSGPWPALSRVKNEHRPCPLDTEMSTMILGSSSLWAPVSGRGLFFREADRPGTLWTSLWLLSLGLE